MRLQLRLPPRLWLPERVVARLGGDICGREVECRGEGERGDGPVVVPVDQLPHLLLEGEAVHLVPREHAGCAGS